MHYHPLPSHPSVRFFIRLCLCLFLLYSFRVPLIPSLPLPSPPLHPSLILSLPSPPLPFTLYLFLYPPLLLFASLSSSSFSPFPALIFPSLSSSSFSPFPALISPSVPFTLLLFLYSSLFLYCHPHLT